MMYNVKFKATSSFRNVHSGERFQKGKTYEKEMTTKQYSNLKTLHKDRNYVTQQPYKIVSARKVK